MEFGDAAPSLPPVGKRQKTNAHSSVKKPGDNRAIYYLASSITRDGAGVNGLLEDKAVRPQDVLRLSM